MGTGKRARAVSAVAVLVGAALWATVAPASAAPESDCPGGRFCIFNPAGNRLVMENGAYDLSGVAGGVFNDNVDWANNSTDGNWCLYSDAGYNGNVQVYTAGYDGNTGGFGWQVSSLRRRPWYGC
ncbi:peptidase inhibitor family I36 protein [Longispora sp. NPDC051575]|uniref:peptidase inhibitor family I36 protein n=1 Tax=Longispora sp. NPDC051575 TaxID=3154943 RepID=UPI00341D3003